MMKKSMCCICAALFAASVVFAADVPEELGIDRVMALTGVGPVSPEWVEGACQYLENYAGFTAAIRPSCVDVAESLDDTGRAVASNMLPQDIFMIALAYPKDETLPHGVYVPDANVCVLNVAKLAAGGDPNKVQRRIGQETLRAAAILVGMPP